MIVETLINAILFMIKSLLGFINFPDIPADIDAIISDVFSYVESGISILGIFLPLDFIVAISPFLIAVIEFDYMYKVVMWIVHKLPFSID